jgi:hypothetical protein
VAGPARERLVGQGPILELYLRGLRFRLSYGTARLAAHALRPARLTGALDLTDATCGQSSASVGTGRERHCTPSLTGRTLPWGMLGLGAQWQSLALLSRSAGLDLRSETSLHGLGRTGGKGRRLLRLSETATLPHGLPRC